MKIETLHSHFLKSSGICTDTRKIKKNCLFFALKGENFNGNEFAQEALDKGAYKAVIDDISAHKNTGETILHGNALSLLQKLATFHRNYIKVPIIALTGSNGKTTTKELINAVLSQKYRTSATQGNLNNHIGVPLTLLSMDQETEMGIVEMGANHLKEIALLSSITEPDFGLITNFGKAHLEGFGGVEGVIRGKSELYTHIRDHDKMVFVNGNDSKQMELTGDMKRITFGSGDFDYNVVLKNASGELLLQYEGIDIQSNLIGIYNFHNIAAAIAIGSYFQIDNEQIKTAIEGYVPLNNRSQLIQRDGFNIIMDAYNANPTSMMAAIENFQQAAGDQKIMILGDMFELGKSAAEEHQHIVNYLEAHPFGQAFLLGSNFNRTTSTKDHIRTFNSFEDFKKEWVNLDLTGTNLLVKGSRGMALERVLELI
ncbi:MAG: UDP-N-acetylmuramoyl-tripeptide--D-alanyl-D-alanine ligase [Bacteroidia bacterium]|nr:UDP-N-acetylmuramoyl-tripeptide--D-alanyl-D-alanine ligase [Bacteroidia bacterium]NNF30643.1 UDP-N-acetylmuramoyl-tripeptide--D-alanyl-D-alanine ligase [Flavobacteriaceae bacterium]MBT8276310.1 UDP-N-acetylmuramoyl-tripeptide--D-alanyl-D-alanine ligase [Bacteroidia bacterium]NNJ82489.1 UDP-N-acetylmuramoyl-tripeptide--D-alanyl-D-alanine ligase [Flavobacteriaceae bacterium]NNK53203.1 UDP-N-acetylmuramoyl-tripeptide--D-alanyl-D-alanine ligase [Flavobacteriaceae bacterium]